MSQGIDTLWKNNRTISDSSKLKILSDASWDLLFRDTAKSRQVCEEMLKRIPVTDNIYARIHAYRAAGVVYQVLEDFSKSMQYYSLSVKLCEQKKDKTSRQLYGFTLTNFATLYVKNGDYQTALKILLKADSLLQPYDADKYRINLYSKIANVYSQLNQEAQFHNYHKKIMKLAEKASDTMSMIISDASFANFNISRGNYIEAENKLKHALKLSIAFKNPNYIINTYYHLGTLESTRKNYPKAIFYYTELHNIATQYRDYFSTCLALKELGSVYKETGKVYEAQNTIASCIALARKHDFSDVLMNALAVAISIEDTLGNFWKALTYNKEYNKLLERNTDLETRKTINFLEAKYQAEKRENDIARLEAQQKIQVIKISRNRLWIIILVVFAMLLTITYFLILQRLRYKKKTVQQENELQKRKISELEKERLLLATQAVMRGEESERTRLARELHDGLGGLLSGIKLKLTGMKGNFIISDENIEQFDKTLNLLDNSIVELRRVAHNMMPQVLIKFGLKDALEDFCQQLQGDKNLKVMFRFFGNESPLDNTVKVNTYRIAQELLNNAIKHSCATQVIVQLVQDETRIHLTVQDNGKGMDTSEGEKFKGAGLSNIKARVSSLNGRLDMDSKPGQGTEIAVEFILQ
jgi:signal transduction histidine kinase